MKKILTVLLSTIVCFTLLVGCSNVEETKEKDVKKESTVKTITDMSGRTMEVPTKIDKVYCSGQPGIVMMHSINLDKLLGWCFDLYDVEKEYIDEKYQKLPVIGALQGKKGTVSKEELLSYNPQIILQMTSIESNTVEDANKLAEDMGIPVVVVDSSLDKLSDSYDFLGELLDEKEVTDKLSKYCRETMEQLGEITSKIPEDKKVRVYYAGGEVGLETAPKGNWHAELLEYAGANNVVDFEASGGRVEVSMEQVITWNPDYIIEAIYDNHLDGVFNSSQWSQISAVQKNNVYSAPDEPYNWVDTPPSINRIIGLKWLVSVLYPDYSDINMKKEVKEFYKLFYKTDLTDEKVKKILDTKVKY